MKASRLALWALVLAPLGCEKSTSSGGACGNIERIDLIVDKTGNDMCAERSMDCISVTTKESSDRHDDTGKLCGTVLAECDSRVVSDPGCEPGRPYRLAPVLFFKAKGASQQCDAQRERACLDAPATMSVMCRPRSR